MIYKNNAITDGGVAPLTMLLTIVIMYHKILKLLMILKKSKDSKEG